MRDGLLTILLLRHGQTDANATGTIQGHLPTPLNALGLRQAELLARRVGGLDQKIDVLVSSDLARAVQTAEPIAAACGLPIHFDAAWRERYLGSFQGKTVGERGIWLAATGHADTPGAEPVDEMLARVKRALTKLPGEYPEARTIGVVTHGGPCRMVMRLMTEGHLPMRGGIAGEIGNSPNCAITRVTFDGNAWSVECVNDVAHLKGLESATDAG
ncbi:MAG TPA: histidine phosphatase family protein [Tepidisphaeraceae bacterium]|jgi:broad specificity phosphatase PhoE|nr:histidine phosphatase family protein [Tepidisphaeraceae bacterium]